MGKSNNDEYVPCPFCMEMIKRTAKACPHCGSDSSTGWSENTYLDGISLDDDSAYDDIYQKEFGNRHGSSDKKQHSLKIIITALLILILLLYFLKVLL